MSKAPARAKEVTQMSNTQTVRRVTAAALTIAALAAAYPAASFAGGGGGGPQPTAPTVQK